MDCKLSLQEKLKDLRVERNLKLADIEKATGISVATLSRFETDELLSIAYQDLLKLAKFYNVSMDYLSGLTNHIQHRNIAIDELSITDEAVTLLKSKKANNRLISELLTHKDFIKLLTTIEIYIDGKISAGSNALNATIRVAEKAIQNEIDLQDKDELLALIREAFIDENACLRYRISEQFNNLLLDMFNNRKKSRTDNEAEDLIASKMEESLDVYFKAKNTSNISSLEVSAKQIGLDLSDFTDEEKSVLNKALEKANTKEVQAYSKRSLGHYKKRK